jgi:iron complex outermembrane receptor protein
MSKTINLLLAISLALFLISPSIAQESGALDEIVVTAQKREETVQDVSISMVVLDQESLAQTRELNDVIALAPNVALTGFSQNQNVITIRAIGSGDDEIGRAHV